MANAIVVQPGAIIALQFLVFHAFLQMFYPTDNAFSLALLQPKTAVEHVFRTPASPISTQLSITVPNANNRSSLSTNPQLQPLYSAAL